MNLAYNVTVLQYMYSFTVVLVSAWNKESAILCKFIKSIVLQKYYSLVVAVLYELYSK